MVGIEYILAMVVVSNGQQISTQWINKFTTSTACEASAQALRQGNSPNQQDRQFVCLKYDPTK